MGAVAIQAENNFQFTGHLYTFSAFIYNASGDTVSVPTGTVSAAVLATNTVDTAPTVTVSAGSQNDTITLTGGSVGSGFVLVTRHAGSLAGQGAR